MQRGVLVSAGGDGEPAGGLPRAAGSGVVDFGHGATLDRTGLGQVAITRTAGLLTDNLAMGLLVGAGVGLVLGAVVMLLRGR